MSLPLIVGITGPYGAGRTTVAGILGERYGTEVISLSGLIAQHCGLHDASTRALQHAGDDLRETQGKDAVAQLAVALIRSGDDSVYVLDGIKNPAEASLLRGHGRFFLLAVQASADERYRRKAPDLEGGRTEFDEIDDRDNKETDQWGVTLSHGQRVADCVSRADAVIWNDRPLSTRLRDEHGTLGELEAKCRRFCALVDDPGCQPPTLVEIRMCQAYAVAQRSSCLQRAVGAVVANADGRILAEGFNEVPSGQPSCADLRGQCYRARLRDRELAELAALFNCPGCGGALDEDLSCEACGMALKQRLPRRKNLDYCRALHAEENAILQISKYGGVGLQGSVIFVTAFPCGLCAKKIVSCGIEMVVFSEPYDVPEATSLFQMAGTEVRAFEGFTHHAFQRVFTTNREA